MRAFRDPFLTVPSSIVAINAVSLLHSDLARDLSLKVAFPIFVFDRLNPVTHSGWDQGLLGMCVKYVCGIWLALSFLFAIDYY